MYQTRASRGSTARSTMRPEVSAGPIGRSSRPVNVFSPYFDSFSFGSDGEVAASAVAASARKIERMQVSRWRIDDLLWADIFGTPCGGGLLAPTGFQLSSYLSS